MLVVTELGSIFVCDEESCENPDRIVEGNNVTTQKIEWKEGKQ